MGLFSFNSKKTKSASIGLLCTDVHSHLLPGIDDGAQTLDQSVAMINKFVELGYKKLITTPHIMTDSYPNNSNVIKSKLELVTAEIQRLGIPIELTAAAEYYVDEFFLDLIDNEPLLTFGDNLVLFEFSFHQKPILSNDLIFKLQGKNYKPILAHFERYLFYNSINDAEELKEKGILIQMNLNSLTGHYGPMAQKLAEQMVDHKIVDLAGSDCHRIEHLVLLEKNLNKKYFHKLLDLNLLNYKL